MGWRERQRQFSETLANYRVASEHAAHLYEQRHDGVAFWRRWREWEQRRDNAHNELKRMFEDEVVRD